jgi:hypothetical protein
LAAISRYSKIVAIAKTRLLNANIATPRLKFTS